MNKTWLKYSTLLLVVITTLLYCGYIYKKAQLIPDTQKYLESILNERSQEIYAYLDQQEKLIQSIAQNKKVVDIFLSNTKDIDPEKIELVTKLYNELPTVQNMIFIQRDGQILISMEDQKNLVGKNITQQPWNSSELSESFARSSKTLKTDISGFEFNSLLKKPALFITTPIIHNGTFYGCILLEIDIEPIYLMLRKYIGLRTTGEVTIGRIKNGKVLYVAPTRHAPNMFFKSLEDKNSLLEDDTTLPKHTMNRATSGEKGSGQALDYRDQQVVAAWSYLTNINWGIVAKIDLSEVLASLALWRLLVTILFLITLMMLIILCIFTKQEIMERIQMPNLSSADITRIVLWTGVIISICAALVSAWYLRQHMRASITESMQEAKQEATQAARLIRESINNVESVVQALADDLSSGTLTEEAVEKRMLDDLHKNPSLIEMTIAYEPYAYHKDTRLYAYTVVRHDNNIFKKSDFGDVYDYTKPSIPGEPESDWYVQAIDKGEVWPNPKNEPYTYLPSITYSVPFFYQQTKKPRGVVSISYDVRAVQNIVDEIKIGQTGYGFAMSRNGTLIAFPTKSYVSNLATFTALAQEKANEKLMATAQRALTAQEPLQDTFFDVKTNQFYSIYLTQVPKVGWSVAVIFANDEISLSPALIRRGCFYIIIALLLGLLCLAALSCRLERGDLETTRRFSVYASIILFIALLATWKTIVSTNRSHNKEKDGTIIVDQSRLNKFLNDVEENTKNSQSDEPQPLFVPTGLYIYSFGLPKIQHVSLSGNIWQKFDLSIFKDIPKEIQFPQDVSLSFKDLTKSIENNTEIRVSTFDTTIFNQQNFSAFPFDTINIRLKIRSQDLTRNIILIPDLAAYDTLNPVDKPGIDKDFVLPGFDIQESYFTLKRYSPDNNSGLHSFGAITEHYDLVYTVSIARKLLNSFILYILPLIVILLALFATLCGVRENAEDYDPLKSLAAYASLFFGLIVLHKTIREQYGIVSTLYIEYAFFYTYLTMLFLVIHAIIVYGHHSNKTFDYVVTPLILYLYWPIQLSLWLTTTLYIFY